MGKLQNIVRGQNPIVSEKSVYLEAGGGDDDIAYGHPGYGNVPSNGLVPSNAVNGNIDNYETSSNGVNLYHSKNIVDTTAIEFPFLDNKSYNIRAIVIYNRDDDKAARRLNGIEIYGLKNLDPNDDVFKRPTTGVPGVGDAPVCPLLANRIAKNQAVLITELKLGDSTDLDITRADVNADNTIQPPQNKAITFLPNDILAFTDKLSPLNSDGVKAPFNKTFGEFKGLRIELTKIPQGRNDTNEWFETSNLHFREIQVWGTLVQKSLPFSCKGKGVGLPCNKICGNKVMYGGPSRGGVPSSIGRSGATMRWINRQAGSWKPKPKCPPN